jgi:hypothetical protein
LKTCLCEEHARNKEGSSSSRRQKKKHCHRHYCPFAHGAKELRTSTLPPEARKRYLLEALSAFASNWCCNVCEPQQVRQLTSGRNSSGGQQLSFVVHGSPTPQKGEVEQGAPPPIWPSAPPLGGPQPPPSAAAMAALMGHYRANWTAAVQAAAQALASHGGAVPGDAAQAAASLALASSAQHHLRLQGAPPMDVGYPMPGRSVRPPTIHDLRANPNSPNAGLISANNNNSISNAHAARMCAMHGISAPPGLDDKRDADDTDNMPAHASRGGEPFRIPLAHQGLEDLQLPLSAQEPTRGQRNRLGSGGIDDRVAPGGYSYTGSPLMSTSPSPAMTALMDGKKLSHGSKQPNGNVSSSSSQTRLTDRFSEEDDEEVRLVGFLGL